MRHSSQVHAGTICHFIMMIASMLFAHCQQFLIFNWLVKELSGAMEQVIRRVSSFSSCPHPAGSMRETLA